MRLVPALLVAVLVAALAGPAGAQQPQPPTQPQSATLAFSIDSGMRDHGRTWELAGEPVELRGVLRPFVPGQVVEVVLFNGRRRAQSKRVRVGARGVFRLRLRPGHFGDYTIRATHKATAQQAAATAKPQRFTAIAGDAHRGGAEVRLLQVGLARLGYATSVSGRYDDATGLAVLAFRKVNDMSRTTTADRSIYVKIFRGQGGFRLRYPRAGRHVEFSWSHQALVLADHGRPELVYHASSGKPSTPTVFGHFHFYSKDPGVNGEGMFDSNYFIGGYAVHGYPDVPTYAASHGCIRVPNSDAPQIFSWIKLGMSIYVYQ